jgi:hypothetical protein
MLRTELSVETQGLFVDSKISSHTLNEVPHHTKHLNGSKKVEIVAATRECGCGHLVNERKVIWLQFLHIRTHLALAV